MSVRQYIGARYVPTFSDVNGGVWDNTNSYEPLTIVKYNNDFYTSKKPVPVGVAITNTDYWVLTGNYNGAISDLEERVSDLETQIGSIIIYTPESYGAVGDGETDDTEALQDCIDAAIDHSGVVVACRTYKISDTLVVNNNSAISGEHEKPAIIFNKIIYSGTGAAFTLKGNGISVIGKVLISDKYGISLGDGSKGLQNSDITISLIECDDTGFITRPSATENIQYISITDTMLYCGNRGIDIDLTTRYIGELYLNNCAFAVKSAYATIDSCAIFLHNFSHFMTGLYLDKVTFEGMGAHDLIVADNVIGQYPIYPLKLSNIRYSEVRSQNKKLLKITTGSGTPKIIAFIDIDEINVDSISITGSDANIEVRGNIFASGAALGLYKGVYSPTLDKILPYPDEYEGVAVSGTLSKLPSAKYIRLTGDTSFVMKSDFVGEKIFITTTGCTLTIGTSGGDVTRTLTANTSVRLYSMHFGDTGMRFLLSDVETMNMHVPNNS